MREDLKYFDGDLSNIAQVPADLKEKYATAFQIPYQYFIDAAAHRQNGLTKHRA